LSGNLIETLHEQLSLLEKMRHNLAHSHQKVSRWWDVTTDFERWDDDHLESLSALKARFAELQDHLAAAMKLIARIEGEDTRLFTYILNYMVQLEILDDMETWLDVRSLRNAATHEYSKFEANKSKHFDELLQKTPYLYETLARLSHFATRAYPNKQQELKT